ncbi:MAG: hypothetical protein GXY58_04540 [Planctomycetaceae bacterium]|nr:hypothetical protein [Planctomycetaceae bacterium]
MSIPRNRLLLIALGLVGLFFVGDWAFRTFYEEPARERERTKDRLTKSLDEARLELDEAMNVGEQLEQLEQKSLPWDAEMARARYQDWLLQLAKDAKLTNTSVDSGEPVAVTAGGRRGKRPMEMYKRFTFSLNSRGDLTQVTKFLYDFYRAGHLHKIRTMSLNPSGQGQQVGLSLSIEALALPNADRETELTTVVSEQLAMADMRDYQMIAQRNFFSSSGTASAWKQIQLSAITSDVHGTAEAWFAVGPERKTQILQPGQTLTISASEVRVVSLDDRTATISIDGRLHQIAIGQNLTEAVAVPGE